MERESSFLLDGSDMGIIVILLFLFVFPLFLGLLDLRIIRTDEKLSYSIVIPLGFFSELAILEVLSIPFILLHWQTSSLSIVYLTVLFLVSVLSFAICRRNPYKKINRRKPTVEEVILGLAFFSLFIFQLYKSITTDFTYMSYDDFVYVTIANDAVYSNEMFTTLPTGVGTGIIMTRFLQSSLIFPAIISVFTDYSVALIEHCILQAFYLFLAYIVYIFLSTVLFRENSKRLAFLVFLSILYIFGHYSSYNTTFRLLMPNYQGKAVLSVSLTPLYLALMVVLLHEKYRWQNGVVISILSFAAVSLTLVGALATIINVGVPIVLSMLFKDRRIKHLLYIPFAGWFPAIAITELLCYRLLI